jgi:hypothetical protein
VNVVFLLLHCDLLVQKQVTAAAVEDGLLMANVIEFVPTCQPPRLCLPRAQREPFHPAQFLQKACDVVTAFDVAVKACRIRLRIGPEAKQGANQREEE